MQPKCMGCQRTSGPFHQCKQCKTAVYCGKECQAKHWNDLHMYECLPVGMAYALIEGKKRPRPLEEGEKKPYNPWKTLSNDVFQSIVMRINDYSSLLVFYNTSKKLRLRMDTMFSGLGVWAGILLNRYGVAIPSNVPREQHFQYFAAELTVRDLLSHPNRTYKINGPRGIIEFWKAPDTSVDNDIWKSKEQVYEIVTGANRIFGELLATRNLFGDHASNVYVSLDPNDKLDYPIHITRDQFVMMFFELLTRDGYQWKFPVPSFRYTQLYDDVAEIFYELDDDRRRIDD